jgi:hypothetical protein
MILKVRKTANQRWKNIHVFSSVAVTPIDTPTIFAIPQLSRYTYIFPVLKVFAYTGETQALKGVENQPLQLYMV